jgi:hypothetical protein
MPNWCYNHLLVEGLGAQRFWEATKGKRAVYPSTEFDKKFHTQEELDYHEKYHGFCFNALVPVPPEVLEKGYSDAGYQWQIDNWGTKWDVYEDRAFDLFANEEGYIGVNFDTAWSPPTYWMLKASQGFPDVTLALTFHEEGNNFCGKVVIQNGKVLVDQQYNNLEDQDAYDEFMFEEFGIEREEEEEYDLIDEDLEKEDEEDGS